jgi:hypothetical protein
LCTNLGDCRVGFSYKESSKIMKRLLSILFIFLSQIAHAGTTIIINEDQAIKHVKGYDEYIGTRDIERENYRRRISRESQILKEKLEKFKYNSSTMSPSVKKTEEAELKKYSNVVRKLDFRLKSEIDARAEKTRSKLLKILKKEIKRYGKKKRLKAIFNTSIDQTLYRARGVSPLNIKVLMQEKNIPDETEKFCEDQDTRHK